MNRRNRWFAGIAGTALALGITATVFAFDLAGGTMTVSGPSGDLPCGVPLTVTATVRDATTTLIAGQLVDWSFGDSSNLDVINGGPTITDANGVATTTVTLTCVPGDRTLTAKADAISAGAVLGIGAGAVLGITAPGTAPGLPRTSTTQDGSPVGNLPIATIIALLAALAGGGIIIRRFAFSPR